MALMLGIFLFEFIQPVAIRSFGELDTMTSLVQLAPKSFFALLNVTPEFLNGSGLPGFLSLGYTHPVYHVLTAASVIWFAGRSLAGEMERGSIQIALSRPVSRTSVYLSRLLGLVIVTFLTAAIGPIGMTIGLLVAPPDGEMVLWHFFAQVVTAAALIWAVGGFAMMVSARSDRMGQAVGISIGAFVISYVIDYFANLWDLLHHLEPFSVFNYYDPATALTTGRVNWIDVAVLVAVGLGAALLGLRTFRERDLPS